MANSNKSKPKVSYRGAGTGQYIKKTTADKNPKTTVKETRKK